MTIFQRERARADSIVRAVIDDLSGRADQHSGILDVDPQTKLCIGVLTPPPGEGEPDGSPRRTKRKPDSIGFDARVEPDGGKIAGLVEISFLVYHHVLPTLAEQREHLTPRGKQSLRMKHRRSKIAMSSLGFEVDVPPPGGIAKGVVDAANEKIAAACRAAAEAMRLDPEFWPSEKDDIRLERSAFDDEASYRAALAGHVPETPRWLGKIEATATATGGGFRLTALFSNATPSSKAHPTHFFDVQMGVKLSRGRFVSKDFVAAELDYRYSTTTCGQGVNAVLRVDDARSAVAETTSIFWQPRLMSRDVGDVASPAKLSGEGALDALGEIEAYLRSYEKRWLKFISDHPHDAKIQAESPKGLGDFRAEIDLFHLGIEALREDAHLLRSFKVMNETAGSRHVQRWRLFQIVFIVSMLPSLLARERPTEKKWRDQLDIADVLWFPTGGGKTEAYFGIIVTAMFYDRLRGKKRGTTAWLRYPLRMLSIQQLQRLVEFVTSADAVRKAHGIDGGDPFTVGYYVGSANTPNYLSMKSGTHPITTLKAKMTGGGPDAGSLRVLQKCPAPGCGSTNVEIDVRDAIQELRIFHRCGDCGFQAPISISDAEIYRYLPTVLVGTVDRLARAGETSHFAHIFGQVDSKCPQHGYASFKECVESGCKLTKSKFLPVEQIKDPTPALLLQDELHLLKESLGTYDSHYEGYLDEQAHSVGTGLPPKRLAATATIEGYDRHVKHIYARVARRFPSKGIQLDDTPYACEDVENPEARIYCGILPFGPTTDQVCARIAAAVHREAERAWASDPKAGENGNYDLSLLYANLKDGVGNMGSSLHELLGAKFVKTLSGEHSLDQVREVIDLVERDVKLPYSERLKCVVATSIISHGVDLERLNVMAFSGFPGRAADYIQASSRVGRKHVGVVFAVYNPVYNIDRSAYVHFREYHERLYQLVQPVPVNKFSESAIGRTFTGIYAATLLNMISREKRMNLVKGNAAVSAFIGGIVTDDEMRERVLRSYGVAELEPELVEKYESIVAKKTTGARMDIETSEEWATYRRLKPVPVSSLRKVQEQIGFRIDARRIRTIDLLRRGVR
ncbi:MAG: DEAD/DEAH box helicase [Candidatus Tyrphobacter sp.]